MYDIKCSMQSMIKINNEKLWGKKLSTDRNCVINIDENGYINIENISNSFSRIDMLAYLCSVFPEVKKQYLNSRKNIYKNVIKNPVIE